MLAVFSAGSLHCVWVHTFIMGSTVLMYDTKCNGMKGSENIYFRLSSGLLHQPILQVGTIVSDDHCISIFKIKVKCCLCINVTDIGFQVFVVVSVCSDFGPSVCDTM